MIGGDKTCDHFCEVASSDQLERIDLLCQSQNSGDDDEQSPLSHYSSFGDSEFERYCSANSVMGTPSLCSSVETFQERDLDFTSLGGSGHWDFGNSSESFRLEGEFSRSFKEKGLTSLSGSVSFSGQKNEYYEGKDGFDGKNDIMERNELNNVNRNANGISDGFSLYNELNNVNGNATMTDDEFCVFDDCGGIVRHVQQTDGIDCIDENVRDVESDFRTVENCLPKLKSDSDELETETEVGENFSDEEKTSSRFEHSDGENSMFGNGTDDDQKVEALNQKNLQLNQESKGEKGNNFLMSSSIAFGSDDWDDFAQETKQFDITSLMLDKTRSSVKNERDVFVSQTRGQEAVEILDSSTITSLTKNVSVNFEVKHSKDAEDSFIAEEDTGVSDDLAYHHETQACNAISSIEHNPLSQTSPFNEFSTSNLREKTQLISIQDLSDVDDNRVSVGQESGYPTSQLGSSLNATASESHDVLTKTNEVTRENIHDEKCTPKTIDQNYTSLQDFPASFELSQSHQRPVKTYNVELNDFCDELVHEMEEILLDSTESSRSRFTHSDIPSQANSPLPLRDGGSTASTSATNYTYPPNQHTHRIDGIEVIGAKQRKGDVSFSERLVGVKEYTVYVVRVYSGNERWEVERRYRDFCTLYRRLKTLFTAQGWVLPSQWSSVERESRKIFGNVSPDVVRERSVLIQDCLRSILSNQFPSSFPSALIWFLSPQKDLLSSPLSNTNDPQSPLPGTTYANNKLVFGKTISLVVDDRPYKSIKQILELQHFTCAGCYKHFDDGKTRVLEFVQTLGWGKPRLCEYSGQLFCSICHTNEIAVLPARVLHHWDFTLYPVSQMAKSYLDSIHDKPMLCVSAVNPCLFSKVPALQQVTGVRRRIREMLPYVRCPFRMSIFKGLASRRYLLESSDFFALRDLIDLSKGAFAALPVMVNTVSRKILEHITEQCLLCCDAGIPCNARQACNDPSALIFPFQEGEIERCRSCKSVFHKLCFRKVPKCPCGESFRRDGDKGRRDKNEMNSSTLDLFGRKPDSMSTMGFISGLFTKAKPEKLGSKDGDTVIPMGSFPNPSF